MGAMYISIPKKGRCFCCDEQDVQIETLEFENDDFGKTCIVGLCENCRKLLRDMLTMDLEW